MNAAEFPELLVAVLGLWFLLYLGFAYRREVGGMLKNLLVTVKNIFIP